MAYKRVESVWLSRDKPRGKWVYALARLSNGMIVVCENLYRGGFTVVGRRMISEDDSIPCNLGDYEKDRIIKGLFVGCLQWLRKNHPGFVERAIEDEQKSRDNIQA